MYTHIIMLKLYILHYIVPYEEWHLKEPPPLSAISARNLVSSVSFCNRESGGEVELELLVTYKTLRK